VIFALELTHDVTVILPLLLAVTIAHGFTVLVLRRSILTEKISRRGYHMSREYSIDPLEIIFAREVVRTSVVALPADASPELVAATLGPGTNVRHEQRLFPIVDGDRRVVGVITRTGLRAWLSADARPSGQVLGDVARGRPLLAYADETLKVIVYRMAETGLTRLPVVDRQTQALVGMLSLTDLLTARTRILDAEQRRERVPGARLRWPGRPSAA
jgi:CBS domain-containing protein